MSTALHDERLRAVMDVLVQHDVRRVVDLGCGSGALIEQLLELPQFERIVGIDSSSEALAAAQQGLPQEEVLSGRLTLTYGSFADSEQAHGGFDAAVMLETLEHVDPRHLSRVERSVFTGLCPPLVIVTTPNREFNVLYDMGGRPFREPDHRFEWPRVKFERWARGVAMRNGYRVQFDAIGDSHPSLGSPTQMAVFRCQERDLPAGAAAASVDSAPFLT